MRLGIVVVYLIDEDDEQLLDLHLSQIKRCTQVPYTIYASVNRLQPGFRRKLEQRPDVMICDIPNTDLRGMEEHAHYLECLTRVAIEDGVSHVVTLHVDSFPIRSGWAEELAQKLSETCVFATLENINTACLFFTRDFFLKYHPAFLLSDQVYASLEFKQYLERLKPIVHSGIGYGFNAYVEGLSWYSLREFVTDATYPFGGIYDDLIFHLQGAVLIGQDPNSPPVLQKSGYIAFVENLGTVVRWVIPEHIRKLLRKHFRIPIEYLADRPRKIESKKRLKIARQRLLADPESFLVQLQEEKRQCGFP